MGPERKTRSGGRLSYQGATSCRSAAANLAMRLR